MVYSHPLNRNTQSTIDKIVPWVGIGLHSGRRVSMQMHPAAPPAVMNTRLPVNSICIV